MTAKIVATSIHYGMRELKALYQKYTTIGLVSAVVLHLLIIGVYYVSQIIGNDDDAVPMVRIMKYTDLGPPPSITNAEAAPQVQVSVPVAKPTVGVPVPVPDAEVSPEQTIATQQELSAAPSPVTEGAGTGGVSIEQDIKIDEDPSADAFIPVEKQPVPVHIVRPEYPELAKRAGVEGKVFVKALVDKDGRVKKALILKSDAEIFNDAAIAAVMQWVFTPAQMNNGPVKVWAAVPLTFSLQK